MAFKTGVYAIATAWLEDFYLKEGPVKQQARFFR